ncbi:outer membrane protein assembly factor BamC [Pseudorhodoferax sp.]|uniref:outer membrane protein assembly factor BamC n=1 Tax=Pseudorhodoferax sp. TaxID=1993553 RepID=UPI0039E711A4
MNPPVRLALLALSLSLGACSVLENTKIDYKSAGKAPTLEVPPDLTQLSRDSRYVVPGSTVSANAMAAAQPQRAGMPVAASQLGAVRIERDGNQRWLVVDRAPDEKMWETVRDFWQENGFLLTTDQPNLGIMETDWAENRAKLPQDFIRNTLGKVLDSFYSTGERDRFRTRIERTATGSEIFISHRGMVEVYPDSQERDRTVWQPRAVDPELEAEFLRRLMVKLGATDEQVKAAAASESAVRSTTRIATVDGQPVVQMDDGFDRAWRRVGLALDRTGFTVEDRDRSQGVYFVRYVAPNPDKAEPGFFGKLFGRNAQAEPPIKYRIAVRSQGNASTVSVLNTNGAPEASANAQRIVKVLADDLR